MALYVPTLGHLIFCASSFLALVLGFRRRERDPLTNLEVRATIARVESLAGDREHDHYHQLSLTPLVASSPAKEYPLWNRISFIKEDKLRKKHMEANRVVAVEGESGRHIWKEE
ncbi:hypothetical protein B0O99DRAFT_599586 [Bisporella sp. PMI_857]|nr:hypothetical protein B0O99DRAFT_599586 [Bisporella sp. PMI_857]